MLDETIKRQWRYWGDKRHGWFVGVSVDGQSPAQTLAHCTTRDVAKFIVNACNAQEVEVTTVDPMKVRVRFDRSGITDVEELP